jgi:flagellar hook-basal body complex protein FliE
MTTPSAAAGAYASLARLANPSANLGRAVGEASGGPSFGELLRSAANVVTAVAETEVAVETMVAVRDRVISAYEEIMRMPI